MISVSTQYSNINRILLRVVGLWPYQRSKLVRFQTILFFSVLASFITFQLTAFITTELSLNFLINILSSVLCFASVMICYSLFWINVNNVKYCFEELEQICNELKDKREIAIIKKYIAMATHFTIGPTFLPHVEAAISISFITMIAVGATVMEYFQYAYGMLRIARCVTITFKFFV